MNAKVYIAGILSALTLVGIGAGAYFLGKNTGNSNKSVITPTPASGTNLRIPSPISVITPTVAPQGVDKANIEAAVKSKNYAALSTYMTNPVSVRIEATECCQPMTPDDAASELKYLDNAKGTWNFNNEEIITGLESSFPESYGNAIIGVSSDNYLVGFQLSAQNFISKISMSVSYKLLLP